MAESRNAIQACYDAVAAAYAARFADELAHKPLDRALLARFADRAPGDGPVYDLGCGPGQTTRFLHGLGVDVRGIDLSRGAVDQARRLHPTIPFTQGDMLALDLPTGSAAGIVAFYAIVHLSRAELATAAAEMARVLRPGGHLLISFHIGDEVLHADEFLGQPVSIDFVLFPVAVVVETLTAAGFAAIEVVERDPYPEVEYQSRRAYVFARRGAAGQGGPGSRLGDLASPRKD